MRRSGRLSWGIAAVALLPLAAGCAATGGRPSGAAGSSSPPSRETGVAGRSVEGRPIAYEVLGDGSRTVLILGTIHGNEVAGLPLVERLGRFLAARPELLADRRVVLVALANPDGFERRQRANARGVDLNRNFRAENYVTGERRGSAALSEPESAAIDGLLERYRPALLVSIHQGLDCIDYDGPAHAIAVEMATLAGLPLRRVGSRPGSLGSYAGLTLGLAVVTPELPWTASRQSADELWSRYGRMLVAAVRYPDALPRDFALD